MHFQEGGCGHGTHDEVTRLDEDGGAVSVFMAFRPSSASSLVMVFLE
jgi:hypothetical protein